MADHFNNGIMLLRNKPSVEKETLIVTGIGRSGTSMVAGVLKLLQVPMGDTNDGVFEDSKLRTAIEFFLHLDRIAIIKENNNLYDKWGFKFPSLPLHLRAPELQHFRNPRVIVIYRDLVATANRAFITDPKLSNELTALSNVTQQQVELFNFVQNTAYPTLLLSYEKFLSYPEQLIDCLAIFCGLKYNPETKQELLQFIKPNNQEYLKKFHGDLS